jgi:hypothetical protein
MFQNKFSLYSHLNVSIKHLLTSAETCCDYVKLIDNKKWCSSKTKRVQWLASYITLKGMVPQGTISFSNVGKPTGKGKSNENTVLMYFSYTGGMFWRSTSPMGCITWGVFAGS